MPAALAGLKVGLYEHSTVARSAMFDVLTALGAEVVKLGFSEIFIPVDTEAIRKQDIDLAAKWVKEYKLDCIVSADGDGDRPLISDENGEFFRGDVAGVLTSWYLGADNVVTPISSNTLVEACGKFKNVIRTKIGSPFVVKAMQDIHEQEGGVTVGYEANGGFLQHNDIVLNAKSLKALPTRDALIVPVCVMLLAKEKNVSLSALLSLLPQRCTASDRIKNISTERSREIINQFSSDDEKTNFVNVEKLFGTVSGSVKAINRTDGIRITFENNDIVHLRPSGNAPELRCYCESDSLEKVSAILSKVMTVIIEEVGMQSS